MGIFCHLVIECKLFFICGDKMSDTIDTRMQEMAYLTV